MSEEENKTAAPQIAGEVFDAQNVGAFGELLDPDVLNYEALPELQHGMMEIQGRGWVGHSPPSPDLHYDIEDIVAGGDQVVPRSTISGTHEGKF